MSPAASETIGPGGQDRHLQRIAVRIRPLAEALLAVALAAFFAIAVIIGGRAGGSASPTLRSVSVRGDLVVNGGFEQGATPWTFYADTSVRESSDSRVGRWALRVRAGAPTYYGIYEQGIVRTKAGRRFRLTAWVKGTVSTRGKPFLLQANERIAGIPDRRLAHADTIMTTRWQHLVATGISRRRDAVIDVYAFVNGDIARGDSFLIDGVDLRSVTGG